MLAAAAGAAGVAISISPDYYAPKHRSLIALGSGWTLLEDLGKPPERPNSGGFVPETVRRLSMQKRAVAEALYR